MVHRAGLTRDLAAILAGLAAMATLAALSTFTLRRSTSRANLLGVEGVNSRQWLVRGQVLVPERQGRMVVAMPETEGYRRMMPLLDLARGAGSSSFAEHRLAEVLEENRKLQLQNLRLENFVEEIVNGRKPQTAAASKGVVQVAPGTDLKFQATELKLGTPSEATEGLITALGLDYETLGELLQEGSDAIKDEFYNTGRPEDKANFDYVAECGAQDSSCLPDHVKACIEAGKYHGGQLGPDDYDNGHGGMTLEDFVNHPSSKLAGLEEPEVLALRLYTTDSYTFYNNPLRQRTRPHPLRMSVWYLAEGLKKLRSVDAVQHPVDFRRTKHFWRGMRNMELNMTAFEIRGGTELAPMSTTDSKSVAMTYATSEQPLIMEFKASGMARGCDISYLSVFPKEKEFLYPPLTYLEPAGTDEVDGQEVILIHPQIS